jgi:hypothetical protein
MCIALSGSWPNVGIMIALHATFTRARHGNRSIVRQCGFTSFNLRASAQFDSADTQIWEHLGGALAGVATIWDGMTLLFAIHPQDMSVEIGPAYDGGGGLGVPISSARLRQMSRCSGCRKTAALCAQQGPLLNIVVGIVGAFIGGLLANWLGFGGANINQSNFSLRYH